MFKNAFYLLILSCFLFFSCRSEPRKPLEKVDTILWHFEKPGHYPFYVLGTMHYMPKDSFRLKKKVKKALDYSDKLYLETSLVESIEEYNQLFFKYGLLKNGRTYKDISVSKDYLKLMKLLDEYIHPEEREWIDTVLPFLLDVFYYSDFFEKEPVSYEAELAFSAVENDVEVKGLESFEEQMSFVQKIPYRLQFDYQLTLLSNFEESKKGLNKMLDLYCSEKIYDLALLCATNNLYWKEFNQHLLVERNVSWMPRIIEATKEQKCLFAVGALHLVNEKGLIQLLYNEGFTVTPILN